MHRLFSTVIKPILDILKPNHIVEVGLARGAHTELLLTHIQNWDSHLYGIDVIPQLNDFVLNHPKFTLYHEGSFSALPKIPEIDLVFLDGDHNYYTVNNELKLIKILSKRGRFPVILFHDVHWPYARRDQYSQPDSIPENQRHPWSKLGVKKGAIQLSQDGGNIGSCKALVEGGARNGVLTAIEDFVAKLEMDFVFVTVPMHNGLGILCPADLIDNSDLKHFLYGLHLGTASYREDQFDYKYRPALIRKKSAADNDALCRRTTVAISSAGASDFIETSLRRIRHHSPESLDVLIVHSGPGFDKIQHYACLYKCRAVLISETRKYHHVAMEAARQLSVSDYIVYLDSDAFPIRDQWIDDFLVPLENGCCCVGPNFGIHAESSAMIKLIFGIDTRHVLHPSCLAVRRDYLDEIRESVPGNIFDAARDSEGKSICGENKIIASDVGWFLTLFAKMHGHKTKGLDVVGRYYGTGTIYSGSVFHAWYNTLGKVSSLQTMDNKLKRLYDITLGDLQTLQQILMDSESLYFTGLVPDHFSTIQPGRWERSDKALFPD